MEEKMASVRVLVVGKVQGVFYRASTQEQAQRLNVKGWVKNLADGSVEIEAEGSEYALEQLLQWCRVGPPASDVEDVIARWGKFQEEFDTFRILR